MGFAQKAPACTCTPHVIPISFLLRAKNLKFRDVGRRILAKAIDGWRVYGRRAGRNVFRALSPVNPFLLRSVGLMWPHLWGIDGAKRLQSSNEGFHWACSGCSAGVDWISGRIEESQQAWRAAE